MSKDIVRVELGLNELCTIKDALKDMRMELKDEMRDTENKKYRGLVVEDLSNVSGLILKVGSCITRWERKYGR